MEHGADEILMPLQLSLKQYAKSCADRTRDKLCDLVSEMLNYTPYVRPEISEVVKQAKDLRCRILRKIHSRASLNSTASLNSSVNESTGTDLENCGQNYCQVSVLCKDILISIYFVKIYDRPTYRLT